MARLSRFADALHVGSARVVSCLAANFLLPPFLLASKRKMSVIKVLVTFVPDGAGYSDKPNQELLWGGFEHTFQDFHKSTGIELASMGEIIILASGGQCNR